MATFPGSRMVTAIEPRKAGRLNKELLKQLTGGGMMKARQIYGEPFAFYPECKLWMSVNNQSPIVGTVADTSCPPLIPTNANSSEV